ncbi:hypothetical protein [Microbacterium sp. H83]|uniref:hypothetical protein n=1 Tax=Microbacterium sp. H83 TaxID=1827324 RepID=UPI0007F37AB8|nr:hypothetical protein [Microbacterium sp. H83]OAN42727.1 hypothetical protein A4X16_09300 [Microbacterium sp. H83]
MSGLSIDHGGAISVDPDALRVAARRMDAVASRLDEAAAAVREAHRVVVDTPGFSAYVDTVALWTAGDGVTRLLDECRETAESTMLMADAYEYVELATRAEALALTDEAAAQELRRRMESMVLADPRVAETAAELLRTWRAHRFDGLEPAYPADLVFGPLVWAAAGLGLTALGTVRPGAALSGASDPVRVAPVATSTPTAPPTSIATSLTRMPTAPGAQVAVEKYSFADGRTKFVAYLAGTRSIAVGGSEPWDMKSNVEMYSGSMSASYQATVDALTAAGAEPGDEVDVVAYSQAGMISSYLSTGSEFDVQMQITAGSPTQAMPDEDQTVIRLAHTDDPVAGLSGGGTAGGVGSSLSFSATREGDAGPGGGLWPLGAHSLESYIETAEMLEASGDPRVEAVGTFWDDLARAETIERTEYRAERIEDPR